MNTCADIVNRIHSDIRGKNFYTALEMERRGEKVLKLNTGNPATFGFEMPESVRNALLKKLDTALGYCDVRGMKDARDSGFDATSNKLTAPRPVRCLLPWMMIWSGNGFLYQVEY